MALGFLIRYLIVHQVPSFPTATANRLAFHVSPQGSYSYCHSIITEAHRNKEEGHPPPTRTLICLMISHTLTQVVRLSFSFFQVRLLYINLRSTLYLLMTVLALSTIPLSTCVGKFPDNSGLTRGPSHLFACNLPQSLGRRRKAVHCTKPPS